LAFEDTPKVKPAWFGVTFTEPAPDTVIERAGAVGVESLRADEGSPTPTNATTAAMPAQIAAMRSSFMESLLG
jgi:hypothetical protein